MMTITVFRLAMASKSEYFTGQIADRLGITYSGSGLQKMVFKIRPEFFIINIIILNFRVNWLII